MTEQEQDDAMSKAWSKFDKARNKVAVKQEKVWDKYVKARDAISKKFDESKEDEG